RGGGWRVGRWVRRGRARRRERGSVGRWGGGPPCPVEPPPPRLRPPQVRFLTTVLEASIAVPHIPPGTELVNSRLVGGGIVVVVVVLSSVVVVVGIVAVVVVVGAAVVVVGPPCVAVGPPAVVGAPVGASGW